MNFQQFITVLHARKILAISMLVIVVGLALVISLVMPKTYIGEASLLINYKGIDPITGVAVPAQLMPGYMPTQIDIITSQNVALKVVDELGLDKNQAAKDQFLSDTDGRGDYREWLAERLGSQLEVAPSKESSLINIDYSGSDPVFAATLANAFADAYIKTSLQLKVEPSRRAAEWFNSQITTMRTGLVKAQEALAKYQQDKGIVDVDQRADVENARLAELSSQLVAAQGQTFENNSKQRQISGSKSLDEQPDVINNPNVLNIKNNLTGAESKLADLAARVSKNHPLYLSAKAEVDGLQAKLLDEMQKAGSSVGSGVGISQKREAEIKAAFDAQKTKVLEINQERAKLNILQGEVEHAQKSLDLAMQRFSQTSLEGEANQSDIAILNPATPPLKPSKPNIIKNLMIATFLGMILALTVTLIVEFFDRRIRSGDDLSIGLEIPLLSTLAKPKSPFKLRKIWRINSRELKYGK